MSHFDSVLGLPLALAKAELRSMGVGNVIVEVTAPPFNTDKKGTLRVVAVRDEGQRIIIAAFHDYIGDKTL